eukprot:scaffold61055_cov17-Tisochrysis_lutea.AAC.1
MRWCLHALTGVRISKPFVEKPVSGEDHNVFIYYPHSMVRGGWQQVNGLVSGRAPRMQGDSQIPSSFNLLMPQSWKSKGLVGVILAPCLHNVHHIKVIHKGNPATDSSNISVHGGGVKRLFRKVDDKSGDYDSSHPGTVRREGSYIYEVRLFT